MNSRRLAFYALALATVTASVGAGAEPQVPLRCPAPFARLLSDRVFRSHAVGLTVNLKTAPPAVKTGLARLYRTAIRNAVEQGPNFADHYTIVRAGCGAATICIAIADVRTGKVYFPPELKSAEALLVDTGSVSVTTLNYRRYSSLLAVVGSANEQPSNAGLSYYIWRGGRLKLLHFTPAYKLCGLPPSTHF